MSPVTLRGRSRLEAKTTAEVAALRTAIEGIAKAHGGRVFNTADDGFADDPVVAPS